MTNTINKSTVEKLIAEHKGYAPKNAKVILIHEDGRLFFAETFEHGAVFWYADSLRASTLKGIIHKLKVIAKKNNAGEWVSVFDTSSTAGKVTTAGRHDRILAAQASLMKARQPQANASVAEVIPATEPVKRDDPKVIVKKDPVVEPVVAKPVPKEVDPLARFVSLRTLQSYQRNHPNDLFLSIRTDGKIIFSRGLRSAVQEWDRLDILVTPEVTEFAIIKGDEYNNNVSGNFSNKNLPSKITFPEGKSTARVNLKYDAVARAYIGSIE